LTPSPSTTSSPHPDARPRGVALLLDTPRTNLGGDGASSSRERLAISSETLRDDLIEWSATLPEE
jgi:hypothetical protein